MKINISNLKQTEYPLKTIIDKLKYIIIKIN